MGTSSANARQHGGDHYKKREYQHWDFVCDVGLHYLLGCATKYIARWRDKNGKEDLEKAVHYLEKAQEREVRGPTLTASAWEAMTRFAGQYDGWEREAIIAATVGRYDVAIGAVDLELQLLGLPQP